MYVRADEALVRLATVAGDLRLALSLVRTAENTLVLGLDELGITELLTVHSEVAGATDFAGITEVALSLAFGGLMQAVSGFDSIWRPWSRTCWAVRRCTRGSTP